MFSKNSLKIPYVDPQEIILAAQAWHDTKKNGTSKHVFMEFTTNIKTVRKWKTGIFILEEMKERGVEANSYHYRAAIVK